MQILFVGLQFEKAMRESVAEEKRRQQVEVEDKKGIGIGRQYEGCRKKELWFWNESITAPIKICQSLGINKPNLKSSHHYLILHCKTCSLLPIIS